MILPTIRPRIGKLLGLATLITLAIASFYIYTDRSTKDAWVPTIPSWKPKHPIEKLITLAQARKRELLGQESDDVDQAALKYRKRRHRHPPPGFDVWFSYAKDKNAVVVEEFFDRIYHDLNPFWALSPQEMRKRSNEVNWEHVVTVREHNANLTKTDDRDAMNRMSHWHGLIKELEAFLPDMTIPFNFMDETRLLVPYEKINEMMRVVAQNQSMPSAAEVLSNYSGPKNATPETDEHFDARWNGEGIGANQYWDLAKLACPPGSPALDFSSIDAPHDPVDMPTGFPRHSFSGYVSNWTLSKDPCQHPALRSLHGTFIESISMSTSTHLLPLFGGSKLPMNNEILIPPAMYLSTDELYAGGGSTGPPWERKYDRLIWRGVASGGRNKEDTWTHFHRHRLLQMLNGSTVECLEKGRLPTKATSFSIPDAKKYPLAVHANNESLGAWITSFTDAGFTLLWPFPADANYTEPYFQLQQGIPMFTQYKSKYLIDVDGNSFSGRFRAFLRSTSLPIKSTIYAEWHDSRLIPWVHFVPMDNSYVDLYGILDFFLGYKGVGGHDEAAKVIAGEGREWAEKVLRREDMLLYTWRLLLEYARICDDQRDVLGWVDDLL